MKEAFEKILERLEAKKQYFQKFYEADGKTEEDECINKATQLAFDDAKNIVQEVAEEYKDGWIPCSERLPEDNGVYFVTLDDDIMPRCIDVRNFRNGVFEQRFIVSPLQGKCPEEKVVAWMPLPEPYKEND